MSRPKQVPEETAVVPEVTRQVISEIIAFLARCDAEYAAQDTKLSPETTPSKSYSSR